MSWQKHSFLWITFCATCQITCSKIMIVGHNLTAYSGCPEVTCQKSNDTLGKFCLMNVKQNTSSTGHCQTESGQTFYFNITNNGSEYEVMLNEGVTNITVLFLPDQPLYLPLDVCLNSTDSTNTSHICWCKLKGILNVNTSLVNPNQTCEGVAYNASACFGKEGSTYILHVKGGKTTCVTCIKPSTTPSPSTTMTLSTDTTAFTNTTPSEDTSAFTNTTPSKDTTAFTNRTPSTYTTAFTNTTPSKDTTAFIDTTPSTYTTAFIDTTPSKDTTAFIDTTPSTTTNSSNTLSSPEASKMMDNLKNIANEMEKNNQTTKPVTKDGVKGVLYIQDRSTEPRDVIMFSSSDQNEINVTEAQNIDRKMISWYVKISDEAFNKSRLENNGSAFVGVLQFKNMDVNDSNKSHIVLNKEVYGISMGAHISNLSKNIEIIIRRENLTGEVSCNSWDGRGNLTWTTSGCETQRNDSIIMCSCSHLTFFAVLMSIPNANITSPHVDTLTYISYIGCGLSMFFLGIALFMHFLLRKNKSSQSTKILINMFVALFILNLSFLSNESIADTQSSSACTVIALIMHYSMLSTFTWFFLQALHMYFWLIRQNITIKNYMKKMIVSGWVCSCPVVVFIAALGEYKSLIIKSTAEKTTRMCWITNHYIHYIVNIGYYSLVFSFTAGVFVMIVSKIIQARNMRVGDVKKAPLKTRLMMILSLLVLLGLTWAVAFFSYGDMIIPSYYIFCVLNSFQGFFLFLYYYHIHNDAEDSFCDDLDRSSSTTNTEENIYT